MAYRTADYLRWQQMPFVIGIEIKLSNNHTCKGVIGRIVDICDDLAGVYPKDFKFVGWHPHCRYYCVPKQASKEEFMEYQQRLLNGEDVSNYRFKGEVKDLPRNFKDWYTDNTDRIARAKSQPYFLRYNAKLISGAERVGYGSKVPFGLNTLQQREWINNEHDVIDVLGKENPQIGLLNIGAEEAKGNELVKEAYELLKNSSLNFVGNVEARDVPLGAVDVVVCDGFSGNVLLKSIEGTAMYMGSLMKHKIFKRNIFSMLGYLLCKKGVNEVMSLLDYRTIGGTQFLGIKKPVIKAHGSSDVLAFRNAIRQAAEAAQHDINTDLEIALQKMKETEND